MENRSNYSSDFEREFELEDNADNEWEADDQEYNDNEFEFEDGNDAEYEDFEYDAESDHEWEGAEDGYEMVHESPYDRDNEFEDRLYRALNAPADQEFEMEMEMDRILHEMEQEYFFGALKKLASKHGGLLKKIAGKLPLPKGLKMFAKGGLKSLRGLLKNKWLQKAAQFIPGAGPIVSQAMDIAGTLDSEIPGAAVARNEARQAVQVAKKAYQNLAGTMTRLRPGTPPAQFSNAARPALQQAMRDHRAPSLRGKRKQIIPRSPGSVVVVHPDKIILYS